MYINILMLRKHAQTSVKPAGIASEESTIHPLPTLFGLLGLTPFKKVHFHICPCHTFLQTYSFVLFQSSLSIDGFGP